MVCEGEVLNGLLAHFNFGPVPGHDPIDLDSSALSNMTLVDEDGTVLVHIPKENNNWN